MVQYLDGRYYTKYNTFMDLKVYHKEEVYQPDGGKSVLKPDIIDIFPIMEEVESSGNIKNNIWTLEKLLKIADVKIVDNKLIINSDSIKYEDGRLKIHLTEDRLLNAEILEDDSKELTLQKCALATIFQRGLDPLDESDGIRWSQAFLEEINALQLMEDIVDAVANQTSTVVVSFDTVIGNDGREYLTYNLSFNA